MRASSNYTEKEGERKRAVTHKAAYLNCTTVVFVFLTHSKPIFLYATSIIHMQALPTYSSFCKEALPKSSLWIS